MPTTPVCPPLLRLPLTLACTAALTLTPLTAAGAERTAYVQAEISAANAGLTAEVRAEKYAAMSADVFSFFRARVRAVALPYADQVEDDWLGFLVTLAP